MLAQIDCENERRGTMVGQLNTAPGGATNAVIRGPRHDHFLGAIVTRDNSTHSSSLEAHRRNQLALSILDHREATPETVAAAVAALRGESLPSLTLRGA